MKIEHLLQITALSRFSTDHAFPSNGLPLLGVTAKKSPLWIESGRWTDIKRTVAKGRKQTSEDNTCLM